MTEDINAIHEAMERKDSDEILRLLHRIRGALSVAGVPSLIADSREIEATLAQGVAISSVPGLKVLLGRCQSLLDQLAVTGIFRTP